MNAPAATTPAQNEIQLVLLISLLAAIHVFVFTAAFPFFNSVDEQLHFDLAVRYSQGQIPRALEPLSPESIRYIVLFSSHAFLADPASLPGGQLPPPLWTQPAEIILPLLKEHVAQWQTVVSTESSSPPIYYAAAGAWWDAGKLIGLANERLLYWLRFLNILVVIAIVWLGWLTAKKIFPENIFGRIAVPALIAFMPQTAFYSINNDILTPLMFGAAFLLMLNFWDTDVPKIPLAAGLGLALAATFLVKISTLPLLAVSAGFIALKLLHLTRAGKIKAGCPALVTLSICTVLPIAMWMLWCKLNFGDFTGSAVKIQKLGWTDRPIQEWLQHPLFTPQGLWIFIRDNLATFWQGEFWWLRRPLAIPALDLFYVGLTLTLLVLALVAWRQRPAGSRAARGFACACLAALFAFFALLSVKYDFQDCFYPSRAHPYFTSGRLFLGALIPVMILLVSGLDFALQKCSPKTKFIALAALLLCLLAGETAVDWRVFSCAYNWYHL